MIFQIGYDDLVHCPSAFPLYSSIPSTVGNYAGFGIANLEQYRMTVDIETSLRLAISV